jgi:transposase InsO family protein
MSMPYTTNPHIHRVRRKAVEKVESGWSIRRTACHFGVHHTTVMRWVEKAKLTSKWCLQTESSRPHGHPHVLPQSTVDLIVELRLKHRRCAEVIHHEVMQMGIAVSLSSVKRVLKRSGLLREKSKWKKVHRSISRPRVENPGTLVQLDTIHILPLLTKKRFYVYTLLDVCSRWAYAWVSQKISAGKTVEFLEKAREQAGFEFHMLQTDHGPEFSKWFTSHAGIQHRHSRVRKPNDNAHLERFNRTIQEECLYYIKQEPQMYQAAINEWLPYYNDERPHLSLEFLSPSQVVRRY